jgi:hypothetical protein
VQLEAIEQNGEILGNLDGIDRCARASACAFVHVCASTGAQGLVRAWASVHLPVRSKLDQIILQASKDKTKAAAVKAANQERRIVTAM